MTANLQRGLLVSGRIRDLDGEGKWHDAEFRFGLDYKLVFNFRWSRIARAEVKEAFDRFAGLDLEAE